MGGRGSLLLASLLEPTKFEGPWVILKPEPGGRWVWLTVALKEELKLPVN